MGILRVDHPDILAFIDCKKDNADITNFNISVGVTEAFMQAVEDGSTFPLIDPRSRKEVGSLDAREVFDRIVEGAWRNGEPGIIFLDRLNRDNAVPNQGEIESTNPCGEQPLLPYESCNLGSINLVRMIKEDNGRVGVNFDKLRRCVFDAVHFLDNVIEINKYPLEQIEKTTLLTRKIGLGVMGWADLLLVLGIPYNSDDAVSLAERIMGFVNDSAHAASAELAKTRGAFPLFSESIMAGGVPLRNATCTTIAPTGTLSIIAGCSSGVEPVFAYAYVRNVTDKTHLVESDETGRCGRDTGQLGGTARRHSPRLCLFSRHQPGVPCAYAGSLSTPHRQRCFQNCQLYARRYPGRCAPCI
jgi:ribonucleoside-diphosphate reductase alpha chain